MQLPTPAQWCARMGRALMRAVERFSWERLVPPWDDELEEMVAERTVERA